MRDYGKVHTSFWTSSTVRGMSEDGRTLAFYLLSCPHGTIAGVARIPDGYACEDLKWQPERVQAAFSELQRLGFAHRCEATAWVWITKHFHWNPPENPNQRKSARKVAAQVPAACAWVDEFRARCAPFLGVDSTGSENPSETVSETLLEPFRNQEQEQKQEQEKTSCVLGEAEATPAVSTKKPASTRKDAEQVLAHLNIRARRNYQSSSKEHIALIAARLRDGATVDQCKAVIDAKVAEWIGEPKTSAWLRPKTLFNATNFANYVGQLGVGACHGGALTDVL
jgi:uncharacterized phage protein (TIGR02220 family)